MRIRTFLVEFRESNSTESSDVQSDSDQGSTKTPHDNSASSSDENVSENIYTQQEDDTINISASPLYHAKVNPIMD